MRLPGLRLLVALTALVLALPASAGGWRIDHRIPSWVQPVPVPDPSTEAAADEGQSTVYLLADIQTRVRGGTVSNHRHLARYIHSAAGIQALSESSIGFDPAWQDLRLHMLRIHRDGKVIDALHPDAVQAFQRERGLERGIYDNSLTVLVFLRGLRVGDVIEEAWTVTGEHPALGGRFVKDLSLAWGAPVRRLHQRILWPNGRSISVYPHETAAEPVVREVAGQREHVWDLEDVPAFRVEDDTPPWYDPWPSIQLTEFATWGEVARWAAPLYAPTETLSPELEAAIARWAELPEGEERLRAAMRFVQDEVRYLGLESGARAVVPHDPSRVFAWRFGDCKDKARLLVEVLRRLGWEADPALVDADGLHEVEAVPPSPWAFNHVIVRARRGDETVWIDATRTLQRGPLNALPIGNFGQALVLREDTEALTPLPERKLDLPEADVTERFVLGSDGRSARLLVTTRYRGAEAESMRFRFADTPRAETIERYLNFYADDWGDVTPESDLEIEDDPTTNELVVKESYTLARFWGTEGRSVHGWGITELLDSPRIRLREMPLWVAPGRARHRIEIMFPDGRTVERGSGRIGDSPLEIRWRRLPIPGGAAMQWDLTSTGAVVAAKDVAAHLSRLAEISDATSWWLPRKLPGSDGPQGWSPLFLAAMLGGAVVMVGRRWRERRAVAPRPNPERPIIARRVSSAFAPGEAAATALGARDPTHAAELALRQRCTCQAAPVLVPQEPPQPPTVGLLGGRRLHTYRLWCPGCRSIRLRYIVLADEPPGEA